MGEEMNISQDELGALLGNNPDEGGDLDIGSMSGTTVGDFNDILNSVVSALKTSIAQGLGEEVEFLLSNSEMVSGVLGEGSSDWYVASGSFTNNGVANHVLLIPSDIALQMARQYSGVPDMENREEEVVGPLEEMFANFINTLAENIHGDFKADVGSFIFTNDLSQIHPDDAFVRVEWKIGDNSFYEFFQNNILQSIGDSASGAIDGLTSDESNEPMSNGGLFGGLGVDDDDGMSLGDTLLGKSVSDVQMPSFEDVSSGGMGGIDDINANSIKLLMDVAMEVTVELGKTKKLIGEILDLNRGSIIELKKLAGEPLDIKVNNKLIARGEVVVIDEYFGVRIIEIVSPYESPIKNNRD